MRRALYSTLRLVSRLDRMVRRRFSKAGLLVLGALIATATVGVDTSQTTAYQLFSFLFFLVLFALAQACKFKPRIRVKRTLPPYATAGEEFEYRIELCNEDKKSQCGLRLLENLSDPRPSFEAFRRGLKRPSDATAFLERYSIWDKWQRMLAVNQPARIAEQRMPELPPDRPVVLTPKVRPHHRGTIRFTGSTLARLDRFGLFKAFRTLPQPDSVLVLPKRYPLPKLKLTGNRMYQHGGMTLATSVGESEEFIGLRDYRAGDPLKHIHWKSFARIGTPVVKEYQDEFFERHALVLDTFTAKVNFRTFEEAVSIAASFAATIETQECLLDLLFVGSEAYCFTAGRGQLHAENMLEILAHTMPCEDKPFAELVAALLERRNQLSGCILVLLRYDPERRALLDELRASALPFIALVVGDEPTNISSEPDVRFLKLDRIEQGLAAL